MKIFLDNKLVRNFDSCLLKIARPQDEVILDWGSLLEALGHGDLMEPFPEFDETDLFQACLSILSSYSEEDELPYLYDRLFADALTKISALAEVNAYFLLHELEDTLETLSAKRKDHMLLSPLNFYKKKLKEEPANFIHDLTLFLGWDQMCQRMARLFDYQSSDSKLVNGLEILKSCLVESYHHITLQGRAKPSFFRLVESLFFYHLREENIQKHTDAEWAALSQSFSVLTPKNEFSNACYIDTMMNAQLKTGKNEPGEYMTQDSEEFMSLQLTLADLMINKLKQEIPEWKNVTGPKPPLQTRCD